MKKQVLTLMAVLGIISLYAQEIPTTFKMQLGEVVASTTELTRSLVASDAAKASLAAKNVQKSLAGVDMELLKGEQHMSWMKSLATLNASINKIADSQDLSIQRKAFADYNQALYESAKAFGVIGFDQLYYQYCPMALDNAGAYWFSLSSEVRNPYFGDKMLKCGMTKETLKF